MNDNFFDISQEEEIAETKRFFARVYGWMSLALIITGLVAFRTASSPEILNFIFGQHFVFYGLLILELVLVGVLVGAIQKMTPMTATIVFVLYSMLNGLTLSCIFFAFTTGSIASVFFITAGTFAVMSLYGFLTKSDLTKLGNILVMVLVGLVFMEVPVVDREHQHGKAGFFQSHFKVLVVGKGRLVGGYQVSKAGHNDSKPNKDKRSKPELVLPEFFPCDGTQ